MIRHIEFSDFVCVCRQVNAFCKRTCGRCCSPACRFCELIAAWKHTCWAELTARDDGPPSPPTAASVASNPSGGDRGDRGGGDGGGRGAPGRLGPAKARPGAKSLGTRLVPIPELRPRTESSEASNSEGGLAGDEGEPKGESKGALAGAPHRWWRGEQLDQSRPRLSRALLVPGLEATAATGPGGELRRALGPSQLTQSRSAPELRRRPFSPNE